MDDEHIFNFLIQGIAVGNSQSEVKLLLQSLFHEEQFVKLYEVSIVRELDIDIPNIEWTEK